MRKKTSTAPKNTTKSVNGSVIKIFFILVVLLFNGSCKKSEETTEQKLLSGNADIIKSAIDDIWRLNKTEYLVNLADILSNKEVREHAAFALSLMASDTVDLLVLNKMNAAYDKTGHYVYFQLRRRKKPEMQGNVKNYLKYDEQNVDSSFVYWFLNDEYEKAAELFNKTETLNLIKKEFLVAIGNKKEKKLMNFLRSIKDVEFMPMAKWAMNNIDPRNVIKTDFKD
ncbi:MAG TPA: hypothetical protein PLF61_03425, partial [Candidatus Goldiibacteriota bacterium]|nr:hypothetical protein [Candidatus Goldiibacteriota bacterium]